jgi:L-lactate dehydrogenase complex protein LldG
MSREYVFFRVRTALGRIHGQAPPPLAPPLLAVREVDRETRVTEFIRHFENLAGKAFRVPDLAAARACVENLLDQSSAVASNSPFLRECGVTSLSGVRSGIRDVDELRQACAEAAAGITSADYALSATGTLVMLSSPSEARLISLLPPLHIAVIPSAAILTGLDELFTVLPKPAEQTSSMVLISGPSRTADIEQILVRGVHGPGEIRVIIVDNETVCSDIASNGIKDGIH